MVTKNMYQKILEFKKKGYSKAKIVKKLKLDPKTVAKYYRMSEQKYREYANSLKYREKAFDVQKDDILEVYKENGYQKLNMAGVYDYLEEKNGTLPGTEKTLRNYIEYLVETNQLEFEANIRVRGKVPEMPFGKQLQIDFGEYTTRSGLKLYIFSAVLSASRYKYVALQQRPFTTLDLIGHLLDCFDFIGGLPEELVIDQDSVMVVSENHGDIIYTQDFNYFIQEMGLRMYVCRKSDPASKGKVENSIKFIKQNFLSMRDFTSLEEAQESLMRWLSRRANGKISQATKRIPAEVIEEEREYFRPLRNSIYRRWSLLGREERIANDEAVISVEERLYSIPKGYRNKTVEIYKTEERVFVFDVHTGEQIAEHTLSLSPGMKIIKREHHRRDGKTTKQIKDEVRGKFSLGRWGEFVEANFEVLSRYVRDQCLEAHKHFSGEVDLGCLDKALEFCLEHKTYTMVNLRDTYQYYRGLEDSEGEDILDKLGPHLKEVSRYKKEIQVAKRELGVYKSLVNIVVRMLL